MADVSSYWANFKRFSQPVEMLLPALQRDVNILSEQTSDRLSKRRSLDHIKKEIFGKNLTKDRVVLRHVFQVLYKPLLRCIADNVENCRENSIGIIVNFAESMDDVTPFLQYIVPAIVARLDQPEIVEPAEEIRLALIQALSCLIRLSESRYSPFVEETVKVLQKTFQDPFPDVKKESCKVVMELAKHCSRALAYHGAVVAKAIIPALQHRHSTVRCLGIQAIRDAIIVDASALEDILVPLRQLTLDKSQVVRECLYSTAGDWLLKLPDRWSLGYKILPLLLAGLTDDIPKSITICEQYMDNVGKLYEEEWNDRLKDEMDYAEDGSGDRPRVGCRHFARENTQKIVNQMLEGMADWNVEVRIKSTQILTTFIRYGEDKITGYTGVILPALYKALAGDEAAVAAKASNVAELIGQYVKPAVYLEVITPALIAGGGGSTQHRLGCLRTLAGILHGTPASRLANIFLQRLTHSLHDRELMNNENTGILAEVAGVAAELARLLWATAVPGGQASQEVSDETRQTGFELFVVLAHLHSVNQSDGVPESAMLKQRCSEAFSIMAVAHGFSSMEDLYGFYFDSLLERLLATEEKWTRYSPELRLLKTLMSLAGAVLGQRLDVIVPLFARMSAIENDVEVREMVLDVLLPLLCSRPTPLNSTSKLPEHGLAILTNIILINGVWRPGRKFATLRGKTIKTLLAMLDSAHSTENCIGLLHIKDLSGIWESHLLNLLISTLEDDDVGVRKDTLSVIDCLLSSMDFDANTFKKLYPELLKRLDDADDDVRLSTARVWKRFFEAAHTWQMRMGPYQSAAGSATTVLVDETGQIVQDSQGNSVLLEVRLDDVHWTAMIKGLTIHMDDTNAELQQAVFTSLQASVALASPDLLREHFTMARGRHRSPRFLDALLSQIPNPVST
ncbi:armadillo-type protein [Powellomyces hirtus]|nr:armadillo-type protein [Powellomyces hirtus]